MGNNPMRWLWAEIITALAIIAAMITIYNWMASNRIPDISGDWIIKVVIKKSSYLQYKDLEVEYSLYITSKNGRFVGEGMKIREGGSDIPFSQRTPIHIRGFVKGRQAIATYILEGARRKSAGIFRWKISGHGSRLEGSFQSEAANSSGLALGYRVSNRQK